MLTFFRAGAEFGPIWCIYRRRKNCKGFTKGNILIASLYFQDCFQCSSVAGLQGPKNHDVRNLLNFIARRHLTFSAGVRHSAHHPRARATRCLISHIDCLIHCARAYTRIVRPDTCTHMYNDTCAHINMKFFIDRDESTVHNAFMDKYLLYVS